MSHGTKSITTLAVELDFSSDDRDWDSNYADYLVGQEDMIGFESGHKSLPGFLLGGTNRSDDLFMYVSTRFEGLEPRKKYSVAFVELAFTTNVPADQVGTGGAPGESVFIKAGVINYPPKPVRRECAVRMNVDKGNQRHDGQYATTMGHFAKTSGSQSNEYETKTFYNHQKTIEVLANDNGQLWLFFGTDSGFESRTEIYFLQAKVSLTKVA